MVCEFVSSLTLEFPCKNWGNVGVFLVCIMCYLSSSVVDEHLTTVQVLINIGIVEY